MIARETVGVNVVVLPLSDERAADLRYLAGHHAQSESSVVSDLIARAAVSARAGDSDEMTLLERLAQILSDTTTIRLILARLDDRETEAIKTIGKSLAEGLADGTAAAGADSALPVVAAPPAPSSSEAPASSKVTPPPPSETRAAKPARKPMSEAHRAALTRAQQASAAKRRAAKEASPIKVTPAARPTPTSPTPSPPRRERSEPHLDASPKKTTTDQLLERLRRTHIRITSLLSQDGSARVEAEHLGWAVEVDGYLCLTRGGLAAFEGKPAPSPKAFTDLVMPAPALPKAPAGVPSLFGGAGE